MHAPLISILIPTYQSDKTLRRTLDSLTSQEFMDWEAWIIDGVSKDGTMDIVRGYAGADGRIHFISEPDQGIYDAMNKGIRLAKGQWLYFLGSDDYLYDSHVLGSFREDLAGNDLDLVYGNVFLDKKRQVYDGEFSLEKLLRQNVSHQAEFFRKDLFQRIGEFNIRYKAFADWDLNIRCFIDPSVRIAYRDRLVAMFSEGGVSAKYDVIFMREGLIPAKLKILKDAGKKSLRPVRTYDGWWRAVRNASVRSLNDLGEDTVRDMPDAVKRMVSFQLKIPAGMLRIGVLSKCCMLMSYLQNLLTGRI